MSFLFALYHFWLLMIPELLITIFFYFRMLICGNDMKDDVVVKSRNTGSPISTLLKCMKMLRDSFYSTLYPRLAKSIIKEV